MKNTSTEQMKVNEQDKRRENPEIAINNGQDAVFTH